MCLVLPCLCVCQPPCLSGFPSLAPGAAERDSLQGRRCRVRVCAGRPVYPSAWLCPLHLCRVLSHITDSRELLIYWHVISWEVAGRLSPKKLCRQLQQDYADLCPGGGALDTGSLPAFAARPPVCSVFTMKELGTGRAPRKSASPSEVVLAPLHTLFLEVAAGDHHTYGAALRHRRAGCAHDCAHYSATTSIFSLLTFFLFFTILTLMSYLMQGFPICSGHT